MYADDSTLYTFATTAIEITAILSKVEQTKLLGVTLDFKLPWSKHIDAMEAKMGRGMSVIKCCSDFLTLLSTKQVLQALVLSHLDYC